MLRKPLQVREKLARSGTNLTGNQHVISSQKTCLIDIPRLPPGSDRRPQVEAIQFVSNGLGHLEDQFREQPLKNQINVIF